MRFRTIRMILAIAVCVGLMLSFVSTLYAGKIKAGVISKLEGTVEVKPRGSLVFRAVEAKGVLYAGDRIRTKSDGWVKVTLDNGNVITLQEDSNLLIRKFVQDLEKDEYKNILDMNLGKLRAEVQKLKGDSVFEIHTPTAVAAARGTIIYMEAGSELSRILVEDGVVEFSNRASGLKVILEDSQTSAAYRDGTISTPCLPSTGLKSENIAGFDR